MTRLHERSSSEEGDEQEQACLVQSTEPSPTCGKMNVSSSFNKDAKSCNTKENAMRGQTFPANPREMYASYILQNSGDGQGSHSKRRIRFKCTPVEWLLTLFPILQWLPKYDWKTDFTYDLVAGATICVMHIPQGMAYALLGSLQPVVGMYMAFFPVIIYSLMGTSRHVSMGTFAVVCLMTGKVATERMASYAEEYSKMNDSTLLSETYLADDETTPGSPYTAEQIATALSFTVGFWQILMGGLRLGSLSVLLSAELVSGFTTGAAIHVLTSQIKNLLGLSLPRRNGIFKIPLTYADIAWNIWNANVTAVIFSIVTISSLVIYNEVLKPIVARKIPMPVPVELLVIVIGNCVSKYWITSQEYHFPIVLEIPTGLPTPSIPPMKIVSDVVVDGLLIAVVAYTISISMAKIFATKHGYTVEPNQELIANGSSNLFGSFFMCAPIAASLSRSLIQEQVGGKTQIAGLFSSFLLIFVLLWIGPFFETLPHCVLSGLIVVSLKGMFLQVSDLVQAYRQSPLNALVWLMSFIATVILDIEYGLAIGLILSIFTLIWRSNKPTLSILGVHDGSETYVDMSLPQAREIPGIKIIKYTGCLNFATSEMFVEQLQGVVPVTDPKHLKGTNNLGGIIVSTISKEKIQDSVSIDDNLCSFRPAMVEFQETISWIILDFSSLSSIDPAGATTLINMNKLYLKKDIQFLFTGCVSSVIKVMNRCGLIKVVGLPHFFPSVEDAIRFCCVPSYDLLMSAVGNINNNATVTTCSSASNEYNDSRQINYIVPSAASPDYDKKIPNV